MPCTPSSHAWARQTARDVRETMNVSLYGLPDMVHRTGSRLRRTEFERYIWLELALLNMAARRLTCVESIYTEAYLRNPTEPMNPEERILDMVGLQTNSTGRHLEFAHVIGDRMTGLEPLICYNQRMKELPVDVSGQAWTTATPGPRNLLPLVKRDHELFDSMEAGPVPTPQQGHSLIIAAETAVVDALVTEDPVTGVFELVQDEWGVNVCAAMEGASLEVSFEVPGSGSHKVPTWEYDWWYHPSKDCRHFKTEGHFWPGEAFTVERTMRLNDGWKVPVVFGGRTRPAIRSAAPPMRVISRFSWHESLRRDSGDPLVMSAEGASTATDLAYLHDVCCVLDCRTFSGLLRNKRPPGVPWPHDPTILAKLNFVKNNPNRRSGRRTFPYARAPWEMEPQASTEGQSSGGAGLSGSASAARAASTQPDAPSGPSTDQAVRSAPATSSRGSPSDSSLSRRADEDDESLVSVPQISAARASLLAEFEQADDAISLFLHECVDSGSLAIRDLPGGWPRIVEVLGEELLERAEQLMTAKIGLDMRLHQLTDEEERQSFFKTYRNQNASPLQPGQHCGSPMDSESDSGSHSSVSSTSMW